MVFIRMEKTKRLVELAKSKLGTDFTPDNIVPDRVSCAYALTTLLHEFDKSIPVEKSTYEFWRYMQRHTEKFERVYEPQAGDIVVSPTGTSTKLTNGHIGIYLDNNKIASNSSMPETLGLWIQNYDRLSWRSYFHEYGRFPVYLFRIIS